MDIITVSPDFQIVIPKEILERTSVRPGQKLDVFRIGGVIELAPVKDLKDLRGSLPDLETTVEREEADRI